MNVALNERTKKEELFECFKKGGEWWFLVKVQKKEREMERNREKEREGGKKGGREMEWVREVASLVRSLFYLAEQ